MAKKLPSGKWLERVRLRDPKTGQRYERKATTDTRAEALEFRERVRAEAKAGSRRGRVKLEAYVFSWAETRGAALKPSVRTRYRQALEHHILPALGDYYVDALTPGDVQQYVTDRIAGTNGCEAGAGNTVLNELRLLRVLSADSVADGVATRHWADRVKPPPVASYDEDNPNLLTPHQLSQLLTAIPRQWLPLVMVFATTPARWGEGSGLMGEDCILWPDRIPEAGRRPWDVVGEIKVRRSNWRGQIVTPKTKRSMRTLPLHRITAELLGLPRQGFLFLTQANGGREGGTLHKGTPLRRILDQAVVALGWAVWDKGGHTKHQFWKAVAVPPHPRITTHGLRRTWNNIARQRGDRLVVQSVTGHATDAMTDHYSLVDSGEKAALATAVARAVFQLEAPKEET